MANLASAKKRNKQNERNRTRNKVRKGKVKTATKKFLSDLQHDPAAAQEQFRTLTKVLDQTAAKGTMHKRTAARRKSRMAKRLNAAQAAKKAG